MIRLPLDAYTFRGAHDRPDLVVELDEEGRGMVRLVVELEPGEVGSGKVAARPLVDQLLDSTDRDRPLSHAEILALVDEIVDLRRRLVQVDQTRAVDRDLLPDEARALAAMLTHFAGEAHR